MNRYVLSLDQGTTSSRAMLFDHDGRIAGIAQHEFTQHFPRTGWVEHDPMDILTTQLNSAVEVLARARLRPRDVVALGITNQRETTLVWDRDTGTPVYNAIVWQDRRTAEQCAQLQRDGNEDSIRRKTGLLIDPYFSATKVAWILDNVQGARARAEQGDLAFGTVDSWLIWNLTSGQRHVTDRTNASRTLLYDIVADRWDPELLKAPPPMSRSSTRHSSLRRSGRYFVRQSPASSLSSRIGGNRHEHLERIADHRLVDQPCRSSQAAGHPGSAGQQPPCATRREGSER